MSVPKWKRRAILEHIPEGVTVHQLGEPASKDASHFGTCHDSARIFTTVSAIKSTCYGEQYRLVFCTDLRP
jgi:hypothetical protein